MHIRSFCRKGKVFCQDGTETEDKGCKMSASKARVCFRGHGVHPKWRRGGGEAFFLSVSFKLFSYTGMLTANWMDLFFGLCISAHPQMGSQHYLLESKLKLMEVPLRVAWEQYKLTLCWAVGRYTQSYEGQPEIYWMVSAIYLFQQRNCFKHQREEDKVKAWKGILFIKNFDFQMAKNVVRNAIILWSENEPCWAKPYQGILTI